MDSFIKLKNMIYNNYKDNRNLFNDDNIQKEYDSDDYCDYNEKSYLDINLKDIDEALNIITDKVKIEKEICNDYYTVNIDDLYKKINNSCQHYINFCSIIAPCCNKVFDCLKCHNEKTDHTLDKNQIKYIQCKQCKFTQVFSSRCIVCKIKFSDYYCRLCKLMDSSSQAFFHCYDCGYCIKGHKNNYIHCKKCKCCMNNIEHICIENRIDDNCPICYEKYDDINNKNIYLMECGHNIHYDCYLKLLDNFNKCPLCLKLLNS